MARKPNHSYIKRQRELEKKAKRDEKLARKRAAKEEKDAEALGLEPGSADVADQPSGESAADASSSAAS